MGKSGSCNNLKTTCSFLMNFATLIDSKGEIMHILLICLPNIKFGCYGNLTLPLAYNERMRECESYSNLKTHGLCSHDLMRIILYQGHAL